MVPGWRGRLEQAKSGHKTRPLLLRTAGMHFQATSSNPKRASGLESRRKAVGGDWDGSILPAGSHSLRWALHRLDRFRIGCSMKGLLGSQGLMQRYNDPESFDWRENEVGHCQLGRSQPFLFAHHVLESSTANPWFTLYTYPTVLDYMYNRS